MKSTMTDETIEEAVQLFSGTVHLAGKVQHSVMDEPAQYELRTFLESTTNTITELLRHMDEVDLSCPALSPEGA